MTEVQQYIKQLNDLKTKTQAQAHKIVNQLDDYITDYVKEEQLFATGKDGRGASLGEYAPFTIEEKKRKGQPYDRITLLNTREFYDGFFVIGKNGNIKISSKDKKTPKLIEDFGNEIFLLNPKHNKIVNKELILPELVEWLFKQMPNI